MVGETVYLKFIIVLYWYTSYLKPLPICWLNSLMAWTNIYDAFVVSCGRNISDDACNRLLPFQNLILFYWKLRFPLLNNAFFVIFNYFDWYQHENTEAAVRRYFSKQVLLQISQCSQEKNLCWSLFLIKLQPWRPAFSLKRAPNSVVFVWILRNFKSSFFNSYHSL